MRPHRHHRSPIFVTGPLLALAALAACGDVEVDVAPAPVKDLGECGLTALCPTLSFQAYGPAAPPAYPSEASYACALDALAKRKPGLLFISEGCEGSCSGSAILIRSDGVALVQGWTETPSGSVEIDGIRLAFHEASVDARECQLREPSFYETCDHAPDGDCDTDGDWLVGCAATTTLTCGGE